MVLISIVQPNLYPTVGLQTPGEVLEANFGESPFVYDIKKYMDVSVFLVRMQVGCLVTTVCMFQDLKMKTMKRIERIPQLGNAAEWHTNLNKYSKHAAKQSRERTPPHRELANLLFNSTSFFRVVSSYLVHYGYSATAEAFAKSTQQSIEGELTSMKNRQRTIKT